jgi:hypothetical protein
VPQEATLAAGNTCVCGTVQFDLLPILEIAALLHCHPGLLNTGSIPVTGLRNAATMLLCLRFKSGGDWLSHLLRRSRQLDCSEPRDRVYAVLGMSRWKQDQLLEAPLHCLLMPDYEKAVVDVYRDATRAAILESGNVYVLGLISHRTEDDLQVSPSWTLKLDRKRNVTNDPTRLPEGELSPRMCLDSVKANSTAEDADLSRLLAPGFTIGTVSECSAVLEPVYDTHGFEPGIIDQFFRSCLAIARIDPTCTADRSLWRHLARTLTINRDHTDHEYTNEEDLDKIEAFYRCYVLRSRQVPHPSKALSKEITADEREAISYWAAMERPCKCRRLCRTDCGPLTLVPSLAQKGDEVALFHPHGFCCLLRPIGKGQYLFIGMCYVDDVRNDELAAEFQFRMQRPDREFVLC